MMKRLFAVWVLAFTSFAYAEKFDVFLDSLSQNLPIETEYMKIVLKKHGTRLALPSLLEKWGVINQDAAATYNSVLNTVVLKEEYTVSESNPNEKAYRRLKSWDELQQSQPIVWPVRLATIFHELSHAEFSWLPQSKDPIDQELLQFLKVNLDSYLKRKYPRSSALDRKIARSELFAYYRDSALTLLLESKNETLLQNGYFGSSYRCRKTEFLEKWFLGRPEVDRMQYQVIGQDVNFAKMELPYIFVKGEEYSIDSKDPIHSQLQSVLWRQMQHHFAPAKSKSEMVQWMNSKTDLLNLIKPCR